MAELWNKTDDTFTLNADGFTGLVVPVTDAGHQRLSLRECGGNEVVSIEVTGAHFINSRGRGRRLSCKSTESLIRGNSLTFSDLLDPVDGIRAISEYCLRENMLNLDVEISTVGPIDDLTLDVHCVSTTSPWKVSHRRPPGSASIPSQYLVATVSNETRTWILFADLGDDGASDSQDPSSLKLGFFRRPLEKGVVLVARLGLCPVSGQCDEEELISLHDSWLAAQSFL